MTGTTTQHGLNEYVDVPGFTGPVTPGDEISVNDRSYRVTGVSPGDASRVAAAVTDVETGAEEQIIVAGDEFFITRGGLDPSDVAVSTLVTNVACRLMRAAPIPTGDIDPLRAVEFAAQRVDEAPLSRSDRETAVEAVQCRVGECEAGVAALFGETG